MLKPRAVLMATLLVMVSILMPVVPSILVLLVVPILLLISLVSVILIIARPEPTGTASPTQCARAREALGAVA